MAEIETNTYSFTDFPEDVQLCILSFLAPFELANFACTSKRFASICQYDSRLWYAVCDRRWGSKTQINKWGDGKISFKLLYRILRKWVNLIGFWRRCGGQSQQKLAMKSPALLFFEWGPSYLCGSRVSPSENGSYCVEKVPFLVMGISENGQIVNYLDVDGSCIRNGGGKLGLRMLSQLDLIPVNVDFIGNVHLSVEENVNFVYHKSFKMEVEDGEEGSGDNGSPGSFPEMAEMYQYYANRMSPGADRASRRQQRRREKEKQGRRRWETEHFLKIVDCSPTRSRPLQGLWKGICDDMKLEFYLVAYDGAGISCRRVGDLSERLSGCTPVFWTSNPTFMEAPFSANEENLYNSRVHLRPPDEGEDYIHWQHPLMDNEVMSNHNELLKRIMVINSSYDLVIPGLGDSTNPWRVEGRVWQYKNGTFGFGFLRDNFIVDLTRIAQNGRILDTGELGRV